jgi:hypothetical protein
MQLDRFTHRASGRTAVRAALAGVSVCLLSSCAATSAGTGAGGAPGADGTVDMAAGREQTADQQVQHVHIQVAQRPIGICPLQQS